MEGADRNASVGSDDAPCLGERLRAIDEMQDERHRDAVEPTVAEREPFGHSPPNPDVARERLARDGHHLVARVDAPHLRSSLAAQRGGEPAGATSDVEHTSASQISQLDEVLEGSPPALVRRAEGVIGPRASVEVRAPLRAHVSGTVATVDARPRRAPRWMSVGSPRSENGISTMSKSSGTTVFGNR